jgi:apolipoprotein D and lipocalin family protein
MRSMVPSLACSIVVIAACAAATAQVQEEPGPPQTVERVDLERYAGLWYEIARIPNGFQDQCVGGVTAEYELRDDGRIDVINRCVTSDGSVDEAKGLARIEDRESNAKLKVSFFSIFGWRPIWGDYWIIGLGDDYEFALIGSPDRKYGWILSREPQIDWYLLERIYTLLADQGYRPGDFAMTAQESPPAG